MFKRKISANSFTNLIADGTSITGDMHFTGVIMVEGKIAGDVIASAIDAADKDDTIIVSSTGELTSKKVLSMNVIIAGTVSSEEIRAENVLRVLDSAKIVGASLYYRTLEIEPGAVLTGCKLFHIDHVSSGETV